jgi:hypothetical protein
MDLFQKLPRSTFLFYKGLGASRVRARAHVGVTMQ